MQRSVRRKDEICISIAPPCGSYQGMPETRQYTSSRKREAYRTHILFDFTKITYHSGDNHGIISVNDRWFQIELGAGCGINFEICLSIYANQPSYKEPIDRV